MTRIERARRYVDRLPPAISGSGGHNQTLATACRLVEFGLSEEEAWQVLMGWNETHCRPPWDEADLRHKLTDAFRRSKPRPEFIQRCSTPGRPTPVGNTRCPQPAARYPKPTEPAGPSLPRIPALDVGTVDDFEQLARIRGISMESVALASKAGLIRFGTWRGARTWFVLDATRRVAQGRRVDGQPLAQGVKAWTLKGSQARWPVGTLESRTKPVLALVEGGPDLLAAFHFILTQERPDVCPVAILGAEVRIHPEALPSFAGKRIRIFAHADAAGDRAAQRWAEQLAAVGADVDAFSFHGITDDDGSPTNDLNDAARLSPERRAAFRCLDAIFP